MSDDLNQFFLLDAVLYGEVQMKAQLIRIHATGTCRYKSCIDIHPRRTQAAPVQYAQGGYEASFGRYEINDDRTFTFSVEGALVRTLIGKDLKRVYDLSGNQLIVRSPDPKEHWRVAWERD